MHQGASGSSETAGISKFQIEDLDFAPGFFKRDSSSEPEAGPSNSPLADCRPKQEHIYSPSLGGSPNPTTKPWPAPTPLTPLQKLEKEWNDAASAAGAASVTLFNDIDSSIPQLKQKFVYSEMDLHWYAHSHLDSRFYISVSFRSPEMEGGPPDLEMFVSCNCRDVCYRPHVCGCQDPVFETNTRGPRALHSFAYTKNVSTTAIK